MLRTASMLGANFHRPWSREPGPIVISRCLLELILSFEYSEQPLPAIFEISLARLHRRASKIKPVPPG